MTMTSAFKAWSASLLAVVVLVVISVSWLDKPIAILVHNLVGERHISGGVVRSPGLSIPLINSCIFVLFGLAAIIGRKFSKLETIILLSTIGVLAAESIKNQLKFAFGRTWPDSWAPKITSLVRDNVYGFNFFHGGQSFESFPSGHAAVTAAVISVFWMLYPRLRIAYVICISTADFGLVLLNLHFLGDVLAGTFVGISAGWFTVAVWRASRHHNVWSPQPHSLPEKAPQQVGPAATGTSASA
jgi:membrane-associated phospholipid phosphatase